MGGLSLKRLGDELGLLLVASAQVFEITTEETGEMS